MGRRTGWVSALACAISLALLSTMPFIGEAWAAGTELIEDGGFEAGVFAEIWDESSTNFETPICDEDSCTNHGGSGALGGTHWALFGDIEANATETAMVAQDVVIQAGSMATLKFALEIPKCSGSALDTFVTKVDDTTVFAANGTDAACGSAIYQEKTVDLSAYGDGATHRLAFIGDFQSLLGGTAFSLDDVSLVVNGAPALASIGNKTGYENQPITFTISAIDPDSDALAYSASGLPPGATFDLATLEFSWTPSDSQAGTYNNVQFSATDGDATDSETISITVNPTDPTTTTLTSFKKTARKVRVKGTVVPAHTGQTVTVTLLRKRRGVFRPVRATAPILDGTSAFAAALKRTRAGLCMVQATFEGDVDSGSSTASKTFRC